jgi:hypothetical protein
MVEKSERMSSKILDEILELNGQDSLDSFKFSFSKGDRIIMSLLQIDVK